MVQKEHNKGFTKEAAQGKKNEQRLNRAACKCNSGTYGRADFSVISRHRGASASSQQDFSLRGWPSSSPLHTVALADCMLNAED